MTMADPVDNGRLWVLALMPPLGVRLYGDGLEPATDRLVLLGLAFGVAFAWSTLFTRQVGRPPALGPSAFAMTFVVMLPGPVAWGAAILALSFGAVFGREVFGGHAILPPALIGLAFAVFSFPDGGFEAREILARSPDLLFAASCLPGAALLIARGSLAWQIAVGAVVGVAATGLLMGDPEWWNQLGLGTFAAGILFLAAVPESAASEQGARWLHGFLVGALVVVIRIANPDQPDGVVSAVLLGGLFAPLFDRAVGWRHRRGS